MGPNILLHFRHITRLHQTLCSSRKKLSVDTDHKVLYLATWVAEKQRKTISEAYLHPLEVSSVKPSPLQDQRCTLFAPRGIAIAMYAQFDIQVLSQTRGIVLDCPTVRARNLGNIVLNIARTVACFDRAGKLRGFFYDIFWLCAIMAACTRLQVLGEFALWDVVRYMPKDAHWRRNEKRTQLTSEYKSR